MTNSQQDQTITSLKQSLEKAFIHQDSLGSDLDPQLIINQPQKKEFLLGLLQDDVERCERFFFSVAFITPAGLNAIKTQLADLALAGKSGRLITSYYQYFNTPEVFQELLKIPNLDVRISEKEGFHSKGYLFKHSDYHSLIIGSSNLTMSALKMNYEWNIRLTSYDHGEIIHQINHHMESEWDQALILTQDWIDLYRLDYPAESLLLTHPEEAYAPYQLEKEIIQPNPMQERALKQIEEVRQTGADKALVISATGTGKTYLSAFDVLQADPEKMLFIVHREQILRDALASYQKVIGGPDEDFGILSGTHKETSAKYLFATIQTISRLPYLEDFSPDHFDYILFDEVHRAGADSYLRVMDYFQPDFLLGMTATPERTDNFNIFELFDYNIAYEIRLQEALEEDFLTPFHYFGVADYEKDGQVIDTASDLNFLVSNERVDFLLEKIDYYGYSGDHPCGLVFCRNKKEALEMAQAFDERGIPSRALTGDDSQDLRQDVVRQLEKHALHYIFTVDIFNEGIDIPKINQVVMMRQTQSSIIFTQQLGRGLRKHASKDYVTIIDFIGNYDNNYLIPTALAGDPSADKNELRQQTFETHSISGLSAINFEHVAKERIYEAIDHAKLDAMKTINSAYKQLKNRLNRIPLLADFYDHQIIKPEIIANKKGTYYDYLLYAKEDIEQLSSTACDILKFLTREIMPGFRLHEIIMIEELLKHPEKTWTPADIKALFIYHNLPADDWLAASAIQILSLEFYTGGYAKIYRQAAVIDKEEDQVKISPSFQKILSSETFTCLLKDILQVARYNHEKFDDQEIFTRHEKYRRRDTLRLLGWEKQVVNQNIGGYTYNEENFVIFVTLDKGEDFQGALVAYEDQFLSRDRMHWFTKSPRTLNSPEVQLMKNHSRDYNFYLFAKKSNDEDSGSSYYLGQVKPVVETITETTREASNDKTQSVVHMDLVLKEPVDYRLYNYLTSFEEID